MPRRILVPVDESQKSTEGLEYALSMYSQEKITVLHVMSPFESESSRGELPSHDAVEEWYETQHTEAEQILDEARRLASEYEADISTVIDIGEPWRTIVSCIEENDIDHVIMGSHGRNDDSPLPLGSVAETVMRRSPVLVSIVR